MAELVLRARPVETVFDLLGRDENDMTAALSWALSRSPRLLRGFLDRVVPEGAAMGEGEARLAPGVEPPPPALARLALQRKPDDPIVSCRGRSHDGRWVANAG